MAQTKTQRPSRAIHMLLVAALALTSSILYVVAPTQTTAASAIGNPLNTAAVCSTTNATDQNKITVSPSHGKVFYIDSGQGQNIDSGYVGYKITNTHSSSQANLYVKLDTFTGGVLGLADIDDASQTVGSGTLSSNASATAFFMLKAPNSTTSAQSHVVHVYQRDTTTGNSTELYRCTYTFSGVSETIKAAANKVDTLTSAAVGTAIIGGQLEITVTGKTGQVGQGTALDKYMMWMSPAARSSWPTSALRLVNTNVKFQNLNGSNCGSQYGEFNDVLQVKHTDFLTTQNQNNFKGASCYIAKYTFTILGAVKNVQIAPVAQISSGTQIKHTDMSTLPFVNVDTSTATITAAATKTAATTATVDGSYATFTYTISVSNSGSSAITVDEIRDTPNAALAWDGTAVTWNGSAAVPPSKVGGEWIFAGPYSIPAKVGSTNGTGVLVYKMKVACSGSNSYNYSNTAAVKIGDYTIGLDGSSLSGVSVSGTCNSTTVTPTTNNVTLKVVPYTSQASNISTDSLSSPASSIATINGSVDSNTSNGDAISFEYGTAADLAGATTVRAKTSDNTTDASTNSSLSTPIIVMKDLTGLSPGTKYYFRTKVTQSGTTYYGEIRNFTTPAVVELPTATTQAARDVTTSTATLVGSVDPNLTPVTASTFQYFSNGSTSTCPVSWPTSGVTTIALLGAGETMAGASPTELSSPITGLTSNTYYCYRISATHAGGTVYGASVIFRAVAKTAQTISWTTAPTITGLNTAATPGATINTGTTITYSSNTTDVCVIDGSGKVVFISEGTCSVTATQPGDLTTYDPAEPVTLVFSYTRPGQLITFPQPSAVSVGTTVTPGATSSSNLTITYTSVGPSEVCALNTGTNPVTISTVGAGTCTVTATQPGNDNYQAASPVTQTFVVNATVNPSATTIAADNVTATSATIHGSVYSGAGAGVASFCYGLSSVTSGARLTTCTPVTISSSNSSSANGNVGSGSNGSFAVNLTGLTVNVTYYFQIIIDPNAVAGTSDAVYASHLSFTTLKLGQTITFNQPSTVAIGTSVTPGATSDSGLTVTYTSVGPSGVCTLNTNTSPTTIDTVGAGTCSITAVQSGDGTYYAATNVTQTFTVTGQSQSITFTQPSNVTVGTSVSPGATASSSLTVTYSSVGPSGVCRLESDGTISTQGVGTCSATANQAGNTTFNPANPVTRSFNVTQAAQTITFPNPTSIKFNETYTLDATASSGLPLTYINVGPSNVCTLSGGLIIAVAPGDCSIEATQGGNTNFSAATPVVKVLVITKAPQNITFPQPANISTGGTVTLGATSDSGLAITYSAVGPSGICQLESDNITITALATGTCTVTANQSGDSNYYAATSVVRTFTISASVPASATTGDPSSVTVSSASLNGTVASRNSAGTATFCYNVSGLTSGGKLISCTSVSISNGSVGSNSSVSLTASLTGLTSSTTYYYQVIFTPNSGSEILGGLKSFTTSAPVITGGSGSTPNPTPLPSASPSPSPSASPSASSTPRPRPTPRATNNPRFTPAPLVTPTSAPSPSSAPSASPAAASSTEPSPSASAIDRGKATVTLDELAAEKFDGYKSNNGLSVQVSGAKTTGQFVVTSTQATDTVSLAAALEESTARNASSFAKITDVITASAPAMSEIYSAPVTAKVAELFKDSGLPAPIRLTDLNLAKNTKWLSVKASVATYQPGSTVYVVVTTQPIILGAAKVDKYGKASIKGLLPVSLLANGGHSLRIIGTRVIDGISASSSGEIILGDEAKAEIGQFDDGTKATVKMFGQGSTGNTISDTRVVRLEREIPWWTVWFALISGLLTLIVRLWKPPVSARRRIVTTVIAWAAGVPAAVIGWLGIYYEIWLGVAIAMAFGAINLFWKRGKAKAKTQQPARRRK